MRSESSLEHFLSVVIILGVGRWIVLGVMSGRCRINCASQFPNDDEDDRGNENSLKENTKIKWTAIIERKKRCQVTRFDPAHLLCQQIFSAAAAARLSYKETREIRHEIP